MKEVTLLTVGKLKEKALIELENNYLKRISSFKFKIVELKSLQENKDAEATAVLKKINDIGTDSTVVLLTEKGKIRDSVKFSEWFFSLLENSSKVVFVIAGAAGPGDELIQKANQQLSLSPLTFPHQLARTLLVEQLYRAQTIFTRHPYHK